jgi:hypothetical protein
MSAHIIPVPSHRGATALRHNQHCEAVVDVCLRSSVRVWRSGSALCDAVIAWHTLSRRWGCVRYETGTIDVFGVEVQHFLYRFR